MADFKTAFDKTSKWEGGYSFRKSDRGGETYRGISRNNWPNWKGWPLVDSAKPLKNRDFINNPALDKFVEDFYRENFWNKVKGDQINNQSIANVLFDFTVTSGYHSAKALQKSVGISADGIIGPQTIQAVNLGCQQQIFEKFELLRKKFYRDIVKNSPDQSINLPGWLNRADSFTF